MFKHDKLQKLNIIPPKTSTFLYFNKKPSFKKMIFELDCVGINSIIFNMFTLPPKCQLLLYGLLKETTIHDDQCTCD